MTFNAANFSIDETNALTSQQVASYDGGADTDSNLQTAGYFPNTLGLVVGDIILAHCTHNGTAGKVIQLWVANLNPVGGVATVHVSKGYTNF